MFSIVSLEFNVSSFLITVHSFSTLSQFCFALLLKSSSFFHCILLYSHSLFFLRLSQSFCCPLYPTLLFILPSLLLSPFLAVKKVGCSLSLFLSLPRSFLTSTDKENMFTMDHFPVWYRRAAEYPAGQFLYYLPRQDTKGRGHTFTEQTHTHTHTRTHTDTQKTFCAFLFPIFSASFSRMSQKSLSDRLISLQPAGYNCSFLLTSLYIYVVCFQNRFGKCLENVLLFLCKMPTKCQFSLDGYSL